MLKKLLLNPVVQLVLVVIGFALCSEMDFQDNLNAEKNQCQKRGGQFIEASMGEYVCHNDNLTKIETRAVQWVNQQ